MNKNGHWYTDKNGNHYFIEDGQSPQEGWEASKRRKMIDNGKFKVSEDGKEYRDVDSEEYNKFEADENDFDDDRLGDRFTDLHYDIIEEKGKFDLNEAKQRLIKEGFSEEQVNNWVDENYDIFEWEDFEEVDDEDKSQYVVKVRDDIESASDKKAFEYIADNIDDLTEAGLISEEMSDTLYNELDKKIDESGEKMPLFNTRIKKEPNPMNEFSGPDKEGPSYAQLEAMDKKEKEDYAAMKADMDKNAAEMNEKLNKPDAHEIAYTTARKYGLTPEQADSLANEIYNLLKSEDKTKSMRVPDNKVTVSGQKPTIDAKDVKADPNMRLNYYLKEKYPDSNQDSLVSDFLKENGLSDSDLKGTDSIADVYEAIMKQESAPDAKEMDRISNDRKIARFKKIKDDLQSIGFRFYKNYPEEKLSQFESKISEFNKLMSEKKIQDAAKVRKEIEEML